MEQELRTAGGGGGGLKAHSSVCFSGALIDGPRIQQLLLHCAAALESNDVTLAQQAMWVLNNIASSQGDPNQRLTSWLLRALVARACRLCGPAGTTQAAPAARERAVSVTELAEYVDLTPWHRFGFTASNGAILRAVAGNAAVHVLDLSVTRCMQWPTLIDMLSKRPGGPPALRITVPSARPAVPPLLGVSDEELGVRLANFAKSKGVQLEFNVVGKVNSTSPTSSPKKQAALCQDLASVLSDPPSLSLRDGEALVVNCQSWIRHVAPGSRDAFLDAVRALNPCLVTVTDEDADLDSPSLSSRIEGCFNFHWILFDALDTSAPRDSPRRVEHEAAVGRKIESVVGADDADGAERSESGARLAERMRRNGFAGVAFDEEAAGEVRRLLSEHATGWGVKREEDMLVLTWKGHGSVRNEELK
ncbi:Scarecrow-like protein 32 [Dichanthelium oligosanthes]|uniref:Scarecrow-like protein 32 n=1 Tax=Dichanthelium oligosanthes TaxID=888268 RepID=A0A1E5VKI6_9POAL|nr:Scarecrow-like protein 32 [Dichanthelium oligosanthes]